MSSVVEVAIVDALNADSELAPTVYLHQPPRNVRAPIVVCQLVGDPNTKHTLARYGGEALLQFDVYAKTYDGGSVRGDVKNALRRIRGTVSDLRSVSVAISNELAQGLDEGGLWRWTIDATVTWEG